MTVQDMQQGDPAASSSYDPPVHITHKFSQSMTSLESLDVSNVGYRPDPERMLHVCLLGEKGIGQSTVLGVYQRSVAEEYAEKSGNHSELPTVMPIESFVRKGEVEDDVFRIRCSDMTGLDIFDKIRKPMFLTAHAVCICFSTNDPESFKQAKEKWLPLVKDFSPAHGLSAPVLLLGLKTDERGSKGVSHESAMAAAEEMGLASYLECTSKQPETVKAALDKTLVMAKEHYTMLAANKRSVQARNTQSEQEVDAGKEEALNQAAAIEPEFQEQNVDEVVTFEEDTNPLEKETITDNLTVLGVLPSGKHAFLQVDVRDMALTSIEEIRPYQNLQYVYVAGNKLRSLDPLSRMPFLLVLDAGRNFLTRVNCFSAPKQLEELDMSYNFIHSIPDMSVHLHLRRLSLRGNFLQRIGPGLKKNEYLRFLDLSENNLTQLDNLATLSRVECLSVSGNFLKSVEGIDNLTGLRALDVSANQIKTLAPVTGNNHPYLTQLFVQENLLSHIRTLKTLPSLPLLADLYLKPNIVDCLPHYREQMLHKLPNLRNLDGARVQAKELVKAGVIYGEDMEVRREIFESLLPNEDFVDRRLVTDQHLDRAEREQFGQTGGPADIDDDEAEDCYVPPTSLLGRDRDEEQPQAAVQES